MKRRTVLIARILLILYLLALAVLCFSHLDKLPQLHDKILGFDPDKLVHFLMFLPFPYLCYFAIGKNPSGPWKAIGTVLLIFLAGCLTAACTEIGQSFFPYRSADPKDFQADAASLALNSLIVFILMLVKGICQSRNAR